MVNPKATTTILAESRPADDGAVVDVAGVLIDGVTYTTGAVPSQFSVRYTDDGREALALAYRRGELNELASGSALPAIESRRIR
jgi:formylmethanofuran dehydrogenase subunit E